MALDDERSQKLFRRAAADPCSEVRSRIPSFLSRYEAGWTREVLEELTTDSEEEIREAAADVIDDWDIADHKMEESEKGLRRLAERVAGEAEPGVRLSLVTALRGTRASWAIRLARKLSDDPDPEVSESMRQVVAEWDARTE
ncbi:MAG: hypothetical protein ISS72_07470 [Candidatus Brocadiae bacterium]|nr:hypothetical protein [Candidatus Brocadiia bacterium]